LLQADIFYTHVQADCPLSSLNDLDTKSRFKVYTMPKRWSAPFIPKDPKFWIDYVSLRQCQKSAFDSAVTVKLIREIGLTLVKIPSLLKDLNSGSTYHYTSRSFCILESYATLAYGAKMLVVLPSTKLRIVGAKTNSGLARMAIDENGEETGIPDEFSLRGYFKSNPIRSANACARGDDDKQVTQVHISHISIVLEQSFNASRACAPL
jgi:hypothetical protein